MTAFLAASINSHNDASVRQAMGPLTYLAQRTGAAIVLLRHLNKSLDVDSALHRGGGSIGLSGSARSVLLAAPRPGHSGEMVLAQTKGNLSRGRPDSLVWKVAPWPDDPNLPHIEWLGITDLTADKLLERPDNRRTSPARDAAEQVITHLLADGPMPTKEAEASAAEAGVSPKTFANAATALGVHRYMVRDPDSRQVRHWGMHLPEQPCPEGCAPPTVRPRGR